MTEQPEPRQPVPLALVAYYGTAVLAGLIVALNVVPYPLDVFVPWGPAAQRGGD
jgi:hypothetical protein